MIAWVGTPEGEGALVSVHVDETNHRLTEEPDNRLSDLGAAVVVIDGRFRIVRLCDIEWLRWPE